MVTVCFPVENIDIKKLYKDRNSITEAQGVLIKGGHIELAKSLDLAVATVEQLIFYCNEYEVQDKL